MKTPKSWQLRLAGWIIGILFPGYHVSKNPPRTGKGSRQKDATGDLVQVVVVNPAVSGVDE